MKSPLLFLLAATLLLAGCETVINATIESAPSQLAVDAWLTDVPGEQRIKLTKTRNYFDNGAAIPATGAGVVVTDNVGGRFEFTDPDNDGVYSWKPRNDTMRLGVIGRTYALSIAQGGESYVSISRMPRITKIDSILFKRDNVTPVSSTTGWRGEFWATDTPGATDYYYIRFFRNGKLQNRPGDIELCIDGAFRGSANTDGLVFIRPIRQDINPENLYALNDTVRVEMRTLQPEGYAFWELLRAQLFNAGLFATPPVNVPSNLRNVRANGPAAVGFFMVSPVQSRTVTVTKEFLRDSGT
jgi:hypothetical protein